MRYLKVLVGSIPVCLIIWARPTIGFIVLVALSFLSFLCLVSLRLKTRSKKRALFNIIERKFPKIANVIQKPYDDHFQFFLATHASQASSIAAAAISLISLPAGLVSLIGWIHFEDSLYVLPLIASVILYFVALKVSALLNYPLYWLMNYGPKVESEPNLLMNHVTLATLVVTLNNLTMPMQLPGDNFRNIAEDDVKRVLTDDESLCVWQCCSNLLPGYNAISRKVPLFGAVINRLDIADELAQFYATDQQK
ncbi:MAG: hypothetical protein A2W61_02705 [Deltaproteobacteria bacterium RIFCSPLOWO2_01_44_7]|nr:MAG: hypothetical protein A2712_05730 [Deltaproteobacteria bacterium RIFCSPHIGHO2_01_FULL_43_49]OGQ14299.1 MAG: hypothetical protein A3D22_04655 [Deltaproteobacteria bacterium RIFCSPHIGHO2_02_FULL_44_53]OGQ27661.1 MAG: hypothetical protein A3D98_09520 [Deltaproteobacteria bacterium RIFCSPHIGHO2_12_FULL_44_21]OGQ30740.1 MAG: hypothetical protein A2979_01065 [Deltaproteobacteria bacterium RIFCSPLOWO2_01_FULL_45_74]OGQ42420.1 MAG: hypothetical protein A3I70_10590 [Deltaproteobacteria bacterium 